MMLLSEHRQGTRYYVAEHRDSLHRTQRLHNP
jgi:hypothetical protein